MKKITWLITIILLGLIISSCDKKNAFLVNRRTATPEKIEKIKEAEKIKAEKIAIPEKTKEAERTKAEEITTSEKVIEHKAETVIYSSSSSSSSALSLAYLPSSSMVKMDDEVKTTDRVFKTTVSKEDKEKASLNEESERGY
ncbi:hypothetical protein AGMMS49950_10050 [Endomicrobiia bacterium]|nr:hypothetical protein AGMMS49950_10050 [Endomicrobiia bacterium]